MITRNDLLNYQELLIEIDALDARIESEYNTYKSPSMMSDGGGHNSDPSDPTARAMNRIDRLKEDRQRLLDRINELESFVQAITDPREKSICTLKYICGYTWQATCWRMRKHYSAGMLIEYDRRWWERFEKESESSGNEKNNPEQ